MKKKEELEKIAQTSQTLAQNLLEEILQASPPLLEKVGSKLGNHALGRERWHSPLKAGERFDQFAAELVKFRVSLPDVHIASLSPTAVVSTRTHRR